MMCFNKEVVSNQDALGGCANTFYPFSMGGHDLVVKQLSRHCGEMVGFTSQASVRNAKRDGAGDELMSQYTVVQQVLCCS